jgi:drug/metabolite transporter (DMT)-like permease
MPYAYIMLTIAFTTYGQLIIKHQLGHISLNASELRAVPQVLALLFINPLILSGLVSAFLASIAWMLAVSKLELSYAYPFMSLNFVTVIGMSYLLFGETLSFHKISGLVLICVGVMLVSRSA